MSNDDRRTALVVSVVGAVGFAALTAALVPWDPVPWPTGTVPAAGSVFSADQIAAAEAFSREARVWSWSSLAVSLAIACWLGFSRLGTRLAGAVPGPWWVRVVLVVAALALLGRMATLPFALLLHGHLVEYGLSTQTRAEYLLDLAKGEAVGVVVTALAVLVVVGCARRWRRSWPAIAGGVLAGFVLVGSLVYPVLVEPIFNDFEPLPDGEFRSQILALADEEGVNVDEVLVADASRRTTTLNAYVSGLGTTRRVVVYDNLVEDLPRGQALSVVAHELAHARHRDVLTGSLLGAAGALCGVGLLGLVVGVRRGPSMSDPVVVPLVLALAALAGFVSTPVQNTISRQVETRADVDALLATEDPEAFVEMQKQLALRSFSDPTPPALVQL
ncbi:MAG: M48 family metalloprotease, partial [Nocardioides sp.]